MYTHLVLHLKQLLCARHSTKCFAYVIYYLLIARTLLDQSHNYPLQHMRKLSLREVIQPKIIQLKGQAKLRLGLFGVLVCAFNYIHLYFLSYHTVNQFVSSTIFWSSLGWETYLTIFLVSDVVLDTWKLLFSVCFLILCAVIVLLHICSHFFAGLWRFCME